MNTTHGRAAYQSLIAAMLLVMTIALSACRLEPVEASTLDVDRESSVADLPDDRRVHYRTTTIDGLEVFYREAGSRDNPTILLLHGFPTSSHMFRDLMPRLADAYHVVAPDYPGFGFSAMPSRDAFDYTFEALTDVVTKFTDEIELDSYSIYLMDYGAPVGFRLAAARPDKVDALIVQNGNAYDEGLLEFWDPIKAYWADPSEANRDALRGLLTLEATQWQFTHGVRDLETVSPDNWHHVQNLLDRPGNKEIQLDLFLSYGTNPPLYPAWQAYLREHQPPMLIVWGKNDHIFPEPGAHPYKRDLKDLEFHILDTGHFALDEEGPRIAQLIRGFLDRRVGNAAQ